MNITIDTNLLISLVKPDEEQSIQNKQAQDIFGNKGVVWTIHRQQFEELLLKTKELIEESSLKEGDQENAKEFYAFLLDLEQILLHGDPTPYKLFFGNPEGEDTSQNRRAAAACKIAEHLRNTNPEWKGEKTDATLVAYAMLEKATVLSADNKYVEPMCSKLKELHRETLPPLWIQRFREFREYPNFINPKNIR
jgi:hypothetical protein